jgi:hypothetical protein
MRGVPIMDSTPDAALAPMMALLNVAAFVMCVVALLADRPGIAIGIVIGQIVVAVFDWKFR